MATTPATITGAVRGIDRDLDGYVLQNEDITENHRLHRVPDQKDKTAYEEVVERTWNLSFTAISDGATDEPPAQENDMIIYPTTGTLGTTKWRWQVDTVKEAGTYNGDRKWSVTAHRYDDWPPQTASSGGSTPNGGGSAPNGGQ